MLEIRVRFVGILDLLSVSAVYVIALSCLYLPVLCLTSLPCRYLAIALGCQHRLINSDYLQTGTQIDLKPLLESIYTRANLGMKRTSPLQPTLTKLTVSVFSGISVLTLFVSYGGISGLARAKGPLPTAPELLINESSTKEKLLWLKRMVRAVMIGVCSSYWRCVIVFSTTRLSRNTLTLKLPWC